MDLNLNSNKKCKNFKLICKKCRKRKLNWYRSQSIRISLLNCTKYIQMNLKRCQRLSKINLKENWLRLVSLKKPTTNLLGKLKISKLILIRKPSVWNWSKKPKFKFWMNCNSRNLRFRNFSNSTNKNWKQ